MRPAGGASKEVSAYKEDRRIFYWNQRKLWVEIFEVKKDYQSRTVLIKFKRNPKEKFRTMQNAAGVQPGRLYYKKREIKTSKALKNYWAKKKHIMTAEEHEDFMKKTGLTKKEHDQWHKKFGGAHD